jgi:lysozyme
MTEWKEKLKEEIRADEALMLFAYPDPLSPMGKRLGRSGITSCGTTGYLPPAEKLRLHEGRPWTIGYGHAKPWVTYNTKITKERAEVLLEADTNEAIRDAEDLVGRPWDQLNGVRKGVVSNMSFNLGKTKLAEFKRTLQAIREYNYKDAALFMSQSLWAKQVKGRADRLIKQMLTGRYDGKQEKS